MGATVPSPLDIILAIAFVIVLLSLAAFMVVATIDMLRR